MTSLGWRSPIPMKNHSPSSASHRAELNRSPDLDAQSHRVGQSWWLHSVTSPKTVMRILHPTATYADSAFDDDRQELTPDGARL